jgi:Lrp/AsnC family transcriptional regulator
MHAYDDFLRDKLLASDMVSGVESRIIMRSVKNTTALPLRLIAGVSEKDAPEKDTSEKEE